ncbi:alpha/beta hydrolase [Bacillus sp. 2205SS5-2]|uniref:alpha/beta hydrolase n=1 Tax=Bacillus sp. 2205SS5-2 TaxID=3109031 RepID=UPI003004403D
MWKWEAENPQGVVVIIHGAMEHHGRYKWLIEMWRSSNFHVVMGDLPGHGITSRRNRGHIETFNEYIMEVKDWIGGAMEYDLPIYVMGHSMGGLIAVRLFQEHRLKVKGLILSSPCLGLLRPPSMILNVLSFGLNEVRPKTKFSSGLTIDMATKNQDIKEMDCNDSLYLTKVSVRWYRELVKSIKLAFRHSEKLQDLPLLVIQGGDDQIVDKSGVKSWFNQVQSSDKHYKEWPHYYHEVFSEEKRDDVFQYSVNFVINQLVLDKKMKK